MPDRLWFSVTGSIATLDQYRVGSYNLDGSRAKDENLMRNISSKVSWQARRNSQLHFLYNFNNKGQFNRTENTGPITDFIDGNATIHQTINSNIVQTRWTSVLKNNLLFDASGSFLHGDEMGARRTPSSQARFRPSTWCAVSIRLPRPTSCIGRRRV